MTSSTTTVAMKIILLASFLPLLALARPVRYTRHTRSSTSLDTVPRQMPSVPDATSAIFNRGVVGGILSPSGPASELLGQLMAELLPAWKALVELRECLHLATPNVSDGYSDLDDVAAIQKRGVEEREQGDLARRDEDAVGKWTRDCAWLAQIAQLMAERFELAVNPLAVFPEYTEAYCQSLF